MIFRIALVLALTAMVACGYAIGQTPQDVEVQVSIAKQIGWLVIQNANLQAQIDDLKKKLEQCPEGAKK